MRVLIVGAMVALLAACGGGGDDGSFTLATKIDFYTTPSRAYSQPSTGRTRLAARAARSWTIAPGR